MKSTKLSWLLIAPLLAGCQEGEAAQGRNDKAGSGDTATAVVADVPIDGYRRDLLQLAFDSASKFPPYPHKKNRGRAQDLVVSACFELEQPKLAAEMAPMVEGWRRGAAFADYAWCCAKVGDKAGTDKYIELAQKVLHDEAKDENAQEWRSDRVRIKIARALRTIGDDEQAKEFVSRVATESAGAVDRSWTGTMASHIAAMSRDDASRELLRITDSFLNQALGEQYTSLMLISGIHGRFFDDAEIRETCEERLFVRFEKLPTNLRLDAMAPLVGHYVDHEDFDGGRKVITTMTDLMAKFSWRAEERLPQLARIAELRHLVGDGARAEKELEEAFRYYNDNRDKIVNIYRCEALRPLALAWHTLGKTAQADDLIALCLEEALENPNSRPRCDDLVETLIAMAKKQQKPSAELWQRMREISTALGDPW